MLELIVILEEVMVYKGVKGEVEEEKRWGDVWDIHLQFRLFSLVGCHGD